MTFSPFLYYFFSVSRIYSYWHLVLKCWQSSFYINLLQLKTVSFIKLWAPDQLHKVYVIDVRMQPCNMPSTLFIAKKGRFYFTSSALNMFRTLIYPSSGACDFSIVLPHWLYVLVSKCVGVSVWLPHGYHPNQPHRNSNTHRNKNIQPMW